ncbi:MAG: hypothetical protein LBI33_05305 [Propionibacteriaceae bacterium]|nr:hypothetical protein [Propionibacteriaceae bacterium]
MGITYPLTLHPAVADDLADAAAYYSEIDSDLPRRLRADVRQSLDIIQSFPSLGSILFDQYRHVTLRVFPYLIDAVGATWTMIGQALGMTRQGAHKKYAGSQP